MNRWFLSDTHFGHHNIIAYGKRPFANVREMDETLIDNWNSLVKPSDHVTHLGDVTLNRGGRLQREAFIKLIQSLNGHKRLHLGNHDHFPIEVYLAAGFEKIYATWRDETGILYSHFPLHPGSLGSAIANVHGHIHQNPSPPSVIYVDKKTQKVTYVPYINISVEAIDYRPINHEDLVCRILRERGESHGSKVGDEVVNSPLIMKDGKQ